MINRKKISTERVKTDALPEVEKVIPTNQKTVNTVAKVSTEAKAVAANTAIVYRGKTEVRRYTLDVHGKAFSELAERFAIKNGLRVTVKNMKPGVACVKCGHINYLS